MGAAFLRAVDNTRSYRVSNGALELMDARAVAWMLDFAEQLLPSHAACEHCV